MELITMADAETFGRAAVMLDTKGLKRAIALMKAVVPADPTIEILSGVLVTSAGGKVTFAATDLDTGLVVRGKGRGNVRLVAHLRQLEAAVKSAKGGSVALYAAGDYVGVAVDGGCSMVSGFKPDDYPVLPLPSNPAAFSVAASTWRPILAEVTPCISKEESRFTLNGAKLICMAKTGIVRLVATDGHRLAYRDWDAECSAFEALIGTKALAMSGKLDGVLSFSGDDNHVFMDNGEVLLIGRKLTGTFPDYTRVLPLTNDQWKVAKIQRESLLAAAQGALAMMRVHKAQLPEMKLTLNGKATVTATIGDHAFGAAALGTWTGTPDVWVKLNAQYLVDTLRAMTTETVTLDVLATKDKQDRLTVTSPVLVRASGVVRGQTVIMPMLGE